MSVIVDNERGLAFGAKSMAERNISMNYESVVQHHNIMNILFSLFVFGAEMRILSIYSGGYLWICRVQLMMR